MDAKDPVIKTAEPKKNISFVGISIERTSDRWARSLLDIKMKSNGTALERVKTRRIAMNEAAPE
jgi:hypothetical protein